MAGTRINREVPCRTLRYAIELPQFVEFIFPTNGGCSRFIQARSSSVWGS